jgi:hypothetical protein
VQDCETAKVIVLGHTGPSPDPVTEGPQGPRKTNPRRQEGGSNPGLGYKLMPTGWLIRGAAGIAEWKKGAPSCYLGTRHLIR